MMARLRGGLATLWRYRGTILIGLFAYFWFLILLFPWSALEPSLERSLSEMGSRGLQRSITVDLAGVGLHWGSGLSARKADIQIGGELVSLSNASVWINPLWLLAGFGSATLSADAFGGFFSTRVTSNRDSTQGSLLLSTRGVQLQALMKAVSLLSPSGAPQPSGFSMYLSSIEFGGVATGEFQFAWNAKAMKESDGHLTLDVRSPRVLFLASDSLNAKATLKKGALTVENVALSGGPVTGTLTGKGTLAPVLIDSQLELSGSITVSPELSSQPLLPILFGALQSGAAGEYSLNGRGTIRDLISSPANFFR